MVKRTPDAQELLDRFDEKLAESSKRSGIALMWTPDEVERLRIIAEPLTVECGCRGAWPRRTRPTRAA